MPGELNDQQNQLTPPSSGEAPSTQVEGVTLSNEQYSQLLDRLAELEGLASRVPAQQSQSRSKISSLDDLVEEGRGSSAQQQQQQVNLEELSNTQLANHILSEVEQIGNKLVVEIQTQKVLREIDKCEAKHDDFWKYEKEIYAISTRNPTLSIEQAYKLAKEDYQEKNSDKTGKEPQSPITQKILNLPPRPGSGGERPGAPSGATRLGSDAPQTIKDAAVRAWNETVGKDKTTL